MRDAVKFFLDRMETNPEEFTQNRSIGVKHNWLDEINANKKYFTEEEGKAIYAKIGNINLNKLKEHIVNKLLVSEQEEKEELSQASLQKAFNEIQALRQKQLLETETTKILATQEILEQMKDFNKKETYENISRHG